VLDVTCTLLPARHDGDFRYEDGVATWRLAHLPGAVHLDVATQLSDPQAPLHFTRPDPAALAAVLAAAGVHPARPVLVYDQGDCLWSARAWYLLDSVGVPARILAGGLASWTRHGLPVTATVVAPEPTAPWVPAPDAHAPWVQRHDIEQALGSPTAEVVCTLGDDAFTGSVPTRYRRRGHIPGSVNLSARALAPEGVPVTRAQMLRQAAAAGVEVHAGRELWLYCGGGISAALAAAVLRHHGEEGVRVYDGSLEEWAADPALPLVVPAGR
jgi:thiosulfate/3-mercaptopyruvate sulfurtransferase